MSGIKWLQQKIRRGLYKPHLHTKKWEENERKNREEKGENSAQRKGIFKSFDGHNPVQRLKRHTQGFDLLYFTISHVGLLK